MSTTDTTDAYELAKKSAIGPLTEAQHAKITVLATDFPTLWNDPATPMRERKRMIRLLVEDVTLSAASTSPSPSGSAAANTAN